MKFRAFILLIPFFSYLTATVKIARLCDFKQELSVKNHCMKLDKSCMKMHGKSEQSEGRSAHSCLDCPICSNCTMIEVHLINVIALHFDKNYPELPSNLLPDFASAHWKPPNA